MGAGLGLGEDVAGPAEDGPHGRKEPEEGGLRVACHFLLLAAVPAVSYEKEWTMPLKCCIKQGAERPSTKSETD
jgi:hypothetical protein